MRDSLDHVKNEYAQKRRKKKPVKMMGKSGKESKMMKRRPVPMMDKMGKM